MRYEINLEDLLRIVKENPGIRTEEIATRYYPQYCEKSYEKCYVLRYIYGKLRLQIKYGIITKEIVNNHTRWYPA